MANPKIVKEKREKSLKAKGEMDYDYVNDILFFKVKGREYDFSLEFQNMVFDIDKHKFITGIQIFDASKFLGIPRIYLREIPKWKFEARISKKIIEVRLFCQLKIRNKIIEKTPIIIQENKPNFAPQVTATI